MFGVEHQHPYRHQHHRQPEAECDQQDQAESDMAQRDRAQQQDQCRGAGNQAAAGTESDQAPEGDIPLRNMGMPVWTVVVVDDVRVGVDGVVGMGMLRVIVIMRMTMIVAV